MAPVGQRRAGGSPGQQGRHHEGGGDEARQAARDLGARAFGVTVRFYVTLTLARAEPPGVSAREDQGALDLLDRLGDLDPARAGIGAVEGGPATPRPPLE